MHDHATRWERIRWSDHDQLPDSGQRLKLRLIVDGAVVVRDFEVVESRMDFEPGWIQVEVRPVDQD